MPSLETPSRVDSSGFPPTVDPEKVRELLSQVERTLTTRRLYAANMAPYREAFQRLMEKLEAAIEGEGFTLRVGRCELCLSDLTVFRREAPEDCWFFPLYRDGVRELVFRWPPGPQELESFLTVLEADRRRLLGPAEDTVVLLWRSDLEAISYSALDGLGEEEGQEGQPDDQKGGPPDDFRALVQEVMEAIQSPAEPVTGQRYAFHMDADVRVSAVDLEYDPATVRRAFEDGPKILPLSPDDLQKLRGEVGSEDGTALLERFVEILLSLLVGPLPVVPGEQVSKVLDQLAEGYWAAGELGELSRLLARLEEERQTASHPETREALGRILRGFQGPERVARTLELLVGGRLALAQALELWRDDDDEHWPLLLDFWAALPESPLHRETMVYLRSRLAFRPELLSRALGSSEAARIHAALALLDHRVEPLFAREVLDLSTHSDPQVRLKAIAAAGRLGGQKGLEALWNAVESDSEPAVRLLAFRQMSDMNSPGLDGRLLGLVRHPSFTDRPSWERRKYVTLLARVGGAEARKLFESWLPSRRLVYSSRAESSALLALDGLAECGPEGLERVREVARGGGRLGRIASRVLDRWEREA